MIQNIANAALVAALMLVSGCENSSGPDDSNQVLSSSSQQVYQPQDLFYCKYNGVVYYSAYDHAVFCKDPSSSSSVSYVMSSSSYAQSSSSMVESCGGMNMKSCVFDAKLDCCGTHRVCNKDYQWMCVADACHCAWGDYIGK